MMLIGHTVYCPLRNIQYATYLIIRSDSPCSRISRRKRQQVQGDAAPMFFLLSRSPQDSVGEYVG